MCVCVFIHACIYSVTNEEEMRKDWKSLIEATHTQMTFENKDQYIRNTLKIFDTDVYQMCIEILYTYLIPVNL